LVQGCPQAPQWFRLVRVLVSQPLLVMPSQFPEPAEQVPRVQTPDTQLSVALARSHVALHAPQSLSVFTSRSQPSAGLPLQSPKPNVQEGTHVPRGQDVVPLALLHVVPQPPQVVTELRSASHPLAGWLSQLAKPELHVKVQPPFTQEETASAAVQASPHWPQLETLVFLFVSHPLFGLPSQSA
jgi:hypothetical protein